MFKRKIGMMGVAAALLFGTHGAMADPLILNFSNNAGSALTFLGTGTGVSFDFGANPDFKITSISGPWTGAPTDLLSGLQGDILGLFSYSTASIVSMAGLQTAPVTSAGGELVVHDGSGFDLTAALSWVDIQTFGTIGGLDASGTIDLSGFSYGGNNSQLMQLANYGDTTVAATFQFVPAQSLSDLASGTHSTSFSGSLNAVPEPSSWFCLAIGAVAMVWVGRRRRAAAKVS